MSPGVAWLIAAIIMLVIEVFTATFFILWIAIAAFIAGIFAFFAPQWLAWIIFAVMAVVLLWITRPLARRLHERLPVRTNVDALIGQTAIVVETIDPIANIGRVRVGSDEWRARADCVVERGEYVRVVAVEGATLRVEPAAEQQP
ncbi:MAG: NfeD family protein [Armatimonadetes bacterium]|nr:NfeD family protein [Armatimonadota bacterium]